MADVLFGAYVVFVVAIIFLCVHPKGKQLQQEYMAWKTTKDYFIYKDK